MNYSDIVRFKSKYKFSAGIFGCWEWTARVSDIGGYGEFSINSCKQRAHRVSYQLYFGPLPSSILLRHKCDNPRCVNPYHLEPGTNAENSADMVSRNRQAKGEKHGRALVTSREIGQIKDLLKCGLFTQQWIGDKYGLSRPAVSHIKAGTNWSSHD